MKAHLTAWGGALALCLAPGFASPAAAQVKWTLPAAYAADNYHSENLAFFAKEVEKESGGKLQVTVPTPRSSTKPAKRRCRPSSTARA